MQLAAPEPLRLVDEPIEQRPGMTLASSIGGSREIIDVEVVTPGKTVPDAKAGHGHGVLSTGSEGSDQPVARGAQDAVYMLDERSLVPVCGSKLVHRAMREACLTRRELPDRGRVSLSHGSQSNGRALS